MKTLLQKTVTSLQDTQAVVKDFKQHLQTIDCFSVFFYGDLGVGKTFFIQQLLKLYGIKTAVNSPTYNYVQTYTTTNNTEFAHFDLYLLSSDQDFLRKGFGEIIEDELQHKLVEWPQKISADIREAFSGTHFKVHIEYKNNNQERVITIYEL